MELKQRLVRAVFIALDIVMQAPNLSFYLPQCLQHGYLVTSTMWDPTEVSLRGNTGADLALGAADF